MIERIRRARRRQAVERTLAGLNARGRMVMAIRQDGKYLRVYVPCGYGVMALSPRTAERYLSEIVDGEMRRALARR